MKLKSIKLRNFRRFADLTIEDLPMAKLVVLAGPNGSGKSSLFDAFVTWQQRHSGGVNWNDTYHNRKDQPAGFRVDNVNLQFHDEPADQKKSFYVRTAYRAEADFNLTQLSRQGPPTEERRFWRMIDIDGSVSRNYQRLASDAFEDVFARYPETTTLADFRTKVIGEIKSALLRLFPDLTLNSLGNPLEDGTFRFDKGEQAGFNYMNLSGGEKAAFDLILDMVVKRRAFNDTVFAIDEPEVHMNTRLQGAVLAELLSLVPEGSQLWIATHSIGMMRKALECYQANPAEVAFLDFEGHDFDKAVILKPVAPTRIFWERVLRVALDDLAELVGPEHVVICEGNPKTPTAGKNEEHDARCYTEIFAKEFPTTAFVSAGSSKEVMGDRLKFGALIPKLLKGVKVTRQIDRDDHSPTDAAEFEKDGIFVLSRRHLECFLYDEEILLKLFESKGRGPDFAATQPKLAAALAASVGRGNAPDDVKSAASDFTRIIKQDLGLTAVGNDQIAFAKNVLVPLISSETTVYQQLRADIFKK